MRRFTETSKWLSDWFQPLSPVHKLCWLYMIDTCDNSGVWSPNMPMMEAAIGSKIRTDELKLAFKGKARLLESGKWFIPSFIEFQQGCTIENLSTKKNSHLQIINLLNKHNVENSVEFDGIRTASACHQSSQVKSSQVKSSQGTALKEVSEIIGYLNEVTGKKFKPSSKETAKHVNARLREGYSVDDFKQVIITMHEQWGSDPNMVTYLRPQTLFGPKFDSYLNTTSKAKLKEQLDDKLKALLTAGKKPYHE